MIIPFGLYYLLFFPRFQKPPEFTLLALLAAVWFFYFIWVVRHTTWKVVLNGKQRHN